MELVTSFAEKILDYTVNAIGRQLGYLIFYRNNIEGLKNQLQELKDEQASVQHSINEATRNGEKIEVKVQHWMSNADQITGEAQQFCEEESKEKTECSRTLCPNLWSRYQLSRKAKKMTLEIAEILAKQNFGKVSYRDSPEWMLDSPNDKSNEGVDSRVQIMNQIMEALHDPSVSMVGLCGLGGVGKTTIAKEIAKKVKDDKMFEKVIMAIVSQDMNLENIQGQIAEMLGMKLDEKIESIRASRLCERLKEEKNLLVILDDLWEKLDLCKVGIPFTDDRKYNRENKACKILMTSRNERLLSDQMKCERNVKVSVLSGDESWELFKRIVGLSIDSTSSSLTSIAFEIVQKCEGLPLAIITAAEMLKEKDANEWEDFLARLKNPLRRSITGIKEVDIILKLSYDNLSSEYKPIFLLSAMLSHDPLIKDLLMYSMGLGLLKSVENMEEAQVGIIAAVSKLKALNMLLDSFSSYHFTMHDVFREVALSLASNELHALIVRHRKLCEWPDKNSLEGYKGICLEKCDISNLPEELHGPSLEFFLLNSAKVDLTIPSMFFRSAKELKVLGLTNMHFSSLPSLNFLKRLTTLCLHSCLLEDITQAASLKDLKVLSLAYSEIEQLPFELAELTSLQMLNLAHCSKLKVIPPKLLSKLKKLEALYMENSFNQWEADGSSNGNENASLDELKDLPISSLDIHIPDASILPMDLFLGNNLKRYKVFIGKYWKWQGNYETSKALKLELKSGIHFGRGVRKLLERVEDLDLDGSNGLKNVLYNLEGRGFQYLKHLRIANNNDIEYVVSNSTHLEVAFPILETLKLIDLNGLKKLCQEPTAADKMLFPRLEILDDRLCHHTFSHLKTLAVKRCDGIVKLIPFQVLKLLNNLEELQVGLCEELEMVFDFEEGNINYKETQSLVIVPLKKLKLWGLPKLKNVWSNDPQGIVSFPSLRHVKASRCDSLRSIFPASIAKGMLHLEELDIQNCGIDVIVAKDEVSEAVAATFEFPRLTLLHLLGLPNLRNFHPQRHFSEWLHLQRLWIQDCDKLEIFENEGSSSLAIHLEESTLHSKYPLVSHEKVISNLEKLRLGGKEAEKIWNGQYSTYQFPKVKLLALSLKKATTFSYKLLNMFPQLEELQLVGEIEEDIFSIKEPLGDAASSLVAPFRMLYLSSMGAKHIWNEHYPPHLLLRLQCLKVFDCGDLKSLGPSFISLQNLTHLSVEYCNRLANLLTSSTARSLVLLTKLTIVECIQIEEIIKKQHGEDDEDKHIIFTKLEYLVLRELPRLNHFCCHNYTFMFPSLEQVIIEKCPSLTMFCPGDIETPLLESVEDIENQKFWDTNLNKTIQHYIAKGVVGGDVDTG